MNIGLFGGTFDPIHRGHAALARAALEHFQLSRIYFVPANLPPHKQQHPLTAYFHRYAMVALATAEEKKFSPSLLESPSPESSPTGKRGRHEAPEANYTVDTVRRLKHGLKPGDQVFFLIGMDAFREISTWRQPEELLRECEFIVASRPGYSLADVANALPPGLRPRPEVTKPFVKQPAKGDLVLKGATVHLLQDVHEGVSATAIRQAAAQGKPLARWVHPAVAEYIRKMGLYKTAR